MEIPAISFPLFGGGFVINSPNYIQIFGIKLYLYGIFIALGFVLAGFYTLRRHKDFGLSCDNILDMIIFTVPSGLIGARLYYIIFNPTQYFGAGKWQNIIKIREGGLAVYGGIIAAGLAVIMYSRLKKIPFGRLADAGGLGLLIGQAVGRWGNFFNREAFGAETSVPWRMGLTQNGSTVFVHPTFLYESLWCILGLVLIHVFSKKRTRYYDGQLFLMYVAWYGFGRYLIEGLRTDSLFLSGTDIRVSQFLAALSFCAAALLLLRNHLRGRSTVRSEPEIDDLISQTEADSEVQCDKPDISSETDCEDETADAPEVKAQDEKQD